MDKNLQGWINLYKPKNISSFFALKKIKFKFKLNKIGHGGTLDPLAEGILPVAVGKTTKLLQFINKKEKKYVFSIKWGEQTTTDDLEGNVIKTTKKIPNQKEIKQKLLNFIGNIEQVPPFASAVKVNGKRSYELFRNNKNYLLKSKKVFVKEIRNISNKDNFSEFEIISGKGFYVRSFARDFAISLGSLGHINSLKRTKVGLFSLKTAILLDDLLKIGQRLQEFKSFHSSVSMLDDILAYEIEEKKDLINVSLGKSVSINLEKLIRPHLNSFDKNLLFLLNNGNVISYGKLNGNLFEPMKVLL